MAMENDVRGFVRPATLRCVQPHRRELKPGLSLRRGRDSRVALTSDAGWVYLPWKRWFCRNP